MFVLTIQKRSRFESALQSIICNYAPVEEGLLAISTNITTYHNLAVLLVVQVEKAKVRSYHFIQYLLGVVPSRKEGGQTS